MDVLQAIKQRRSIHTFKQAEVPDAILKEIFTYASYAPTHYMKEPWNIKLYQEKGKENFVDEIMKSYQRIGMLQTSDDKKTKKMIESMKQFLLAIPHHALIYYPQEADPVRNEEEYSAVCAFIQNAQLAAWKYAVGMLWTITPYMHDPLFARAIGLNSEKMKIVAVMQIGYPENIPRNRGRTAIENKLKIIRE